MRDRVLTISGVIVVSAWIVLIGTYTACSAIDPGDCAQAREALAQAAIVVVLVCEAEIVDEQECREATEALNRAQAVVEAVCNLPQGGAFGERQAAVEKARVD